MLDIIKRAVSGLGQQDFEPEYRESQSGQSVVVFPADVEVGEWSHPSDTVLSVDQGLAPGSEIANFTTFVHSGVSGKQEDVYSQIIGVLNYEYPGKFVQDYRDGSGDVLYNTTENVDNLTPRVADAHISHHARVIAEVAPELQHLQLRLNLQPRTEAGETASFVLDWAKSFLGIKELIGDPQIKYLPRKE